MKDRETIREQLADVFYDDESCNDPECAVCEATLDALVDRVIFLGVR